jgi:hypothetical protein
MMEEFGACTAPPGSDTVDWQWSHRGRHLRQVMIGEDRLAEHLEQVLPRLVEVGSRGAVMWCFADYHESLWDRPPCDVQLHERHFGLVRPDGSLKPHADVLRRFVASGPIISEPSARARMALDGAAFYADPEAAALALYRDFRSAR